MKCFIVLDGNYLVSAGQYWTVIVVLECGTVPGQQGSDSERGMVPDSASECGTVPDSARERDMDTMAL